MEAILAGIGALVAAVGGVILIVREFRRRDHRAMTRQLDDLTQEVWALRVDLVAYRRWAFTVQRQAVGVELPVEPEPHRTAGQL